MLEESRKETRSLLEEWLDMISPHIDKEQLLRLVDVAMSFPDITAEEAVWLVRVTKSEKAVAA